MPQGRRWPELQSHFEPMWSMALRALDDIKVGPSGHSSGHIKSHLAFAWMCAREHLSLGPLRRLHGSACHSSCLRKRSKQLHLRTVADLMPFR